MLFLLQSDVTVNNWPEYDVFGQFFLPVLSFLFVCVLAYFATKWLSGAKGFKNARTRNISIWDSISVGYQKTLQIIKVGNKYYLIATTKDRVTYLTEIPDTSILDVSDASDNGSSDAEGVSSGLFEKYLKQFVPKKNDDTK